MALYVALMSMSIDMVMPALALIGKDLGVTDVNQTQYIVIILFLGFTFGQIICGPIADSFGRKPAIYIGLIIFAVGSILSLCAHNFYAMLLGRFLQGFGAAAPRIASTAIIRDLYKGREMARIMSFIMTIFITIPIIAPSIGQAILLVASWRVMFVIFLCAAIIAAIWTFKRLPETLKQQDIRPFNLPTIWNDLRFVVKNRTSLSYTICAGLVFGALVGYLTSSRQIFQEYFQVGNLFPLYFGLSALSIGVSSVVNSMIVRKYGMRLLCNRALIAMMIASILFLLLSIIKSGNIEIWQFMFFTIIVFFCLGLLFGNLNALAMEPMGHIAGIAAAVIGFISSGISVLTGTLIGQSYNNSLTPMITGFLALSIAAFALQKWGIGKDLRKN
ncbi:MAG: DHA1 family bicyclomycin/chloramphenicol resistance-like MFS transporter [Rickettsiales bacterium]|jgi:DHA1 family bicyclomycin/chloramphenicol resistance-like MFS transporter